jgi:hypothetical protein
VRGFNSAEEQLYSENRQIGFVQHLEPRAYVGNDGVVFPPHMRSVKKYKKNNIESHEILIALKRGWIRRVFGPALGPSMVCCNGFHRALPSLLLLCLSSKHDSIIILMDLLQKKIKITEGISVAHWSTMTLVVS